MIYYELPSTDVTLDLLALDKNSMVKNQLEAKNF